MSIMTDARLRLLEARVAEIERRLVESGAVAAPAMADETGPRTASKTRQRAGAQKTSKRTRKAP